jgi:hypothetical protein
MVNSRKPLHELVGKRSEILALGMSPCILLGAAHADAGLSAGSRSVVEACWGLQ